MPSFIKSFPDEFLFEFRLSNSEVFYNFYFNNPKTTIGYVETNLEFSDKWTLESEWFIQYNGKHYARLSNLVNGVFACAILFAPYKIELKTLEKIKKNKVILNAAADFTTINR